MNEFMVCVENAGYEASLEVWKIYQLLPLTEKERRSGMVRVIDESGEDYLYPERFFSAVVMPPETLERLSQHRS
jgi:hypothetical protein